MANLDGFNGRIKLQNLVPVNRWDERFSFIKKVTLYKWKHYNRFPNLFVKFGGRLLIDLDELTRIMEAGRGKRR